MGCLNVKNATYVYNYDNAGNITSIVSYPLTAADSTPTGATSTKTYGYSNSAWGDLLTSFKGHTITYDAIGNPLSYYNGTSYTFSWTGRQLTGATKGNNTYSFTYGDNGIRTSKTVNGVTTKYYLNGSRIIGEETNGEQIFYVYDYNGNIVGMTFNYDDNYSYDSYWFRRNLQGDIVEVYNDSGSKIISYKYDAYGNFTATYHNGMTASTAPKIPFLYRGYYYDYDLGLYYLNSRYYDSNTGRFINADSALYHNMLGYNMFAYCYNNPVNYVDYYGESPNLWLWLTGAGTIAGIEPTVIGEIILAAGLVVIGGIVVGEKIVNGIEIIKDFVDSYNDDYVAAPPQSITQNSDFSITEDSTYELKNGYDPNPYARPGEKKQNRENRSRSRQKDDWEPRNNKRDGKPAKPKSHTPSKKGHQKYLSLEYSIEIF